MTRDIGQLETAALLDGRYQLQERVGVGGMAEVYRAEDLLLGRTVAIKLMRSDADVLAAPARAEREVNALSSVTDPSLVTLFEAKIDAGDTRYLVMEFVDGPTLAQRLFDGALPLAQVRHLALELAGGLHSVHRAGLVHRDIKPSNILLAPAPMPSVEFHVKLADFGLAQLTDSATITTPGVLLGTAAYLAPEQVRGESCGPAADIYAFGLVLLEAITGERAYPHASGIGAVIARLVEPPAIPDDLAEPWSDLIRRMTASDPADRPTALEIIHLFSGRAALAPPERAAQATSASPPVPVARAARPGGPRPAAVRHRRGRRLSRPVLVAASAAAAGIVCASALLTGVAFPATGPQTAEKSSLEQVVPGTLPGATPLAEQPLTIDTVDAPVAHDPAPASVDADPLIAVDAKSAEKDAREAQKLQEAAVRQAEKDAAAQRRQAEKAARDADKAAREATKKRP